MLWLEKYDSSWKSVPSLLSETYRLSCLQGFDLDKGHMVLLLKSACRLGNEDILLGIFEATLFSDEEVMEAPVVAIALKAQHFSLFNRLLTYLDWDLTMKIKPTSYFAGVRPWWSLVHVVIADGTLRTDVKLSILFSCR